MSVAFPDGQEPVADGFIDLSADGSTLAYLGPGAGAEPQLWIRRLDALDSTPVPGTEGALFFAMSPDGSEIAFTVGAGGRALRIVPVGGGVARTVASEAQVFCCPNWQSEGDWIVFYDIGRGQSRVPPNGGAVEVLLRDPPDVKTWAHLRN